MKNIKITIGIINNILYGFAVVLVITLGVGLAFSMLNVPGGIRMYVVESGSMEPNLGIGSLAFVKPEQNYYKNDIVTFRSEAEKEIEMPKYTITHRIKQVKSVNGVNEFITKGDANDAQDSQSTRKELIIGKVFFSIPLIGYLVSYAKTTLGFILLIVIPATIIIYSGMLNIKNETIKLLKKRKKLSTKEKIEVAIGKEEIALEKSVEKGIEKVLDKNKK